MHEPAGLSLINFLADLETDIGGGNAPSNASKSLLTETVITMKCEWISKACLKFTGLIRNEKLSIKKVGTYRFETKNKGTCW